MKVYTEVNYIWKDNKLVQTDSKSFDYEGEVESCHWYHRHSTSVAIPKVTVPTLPKVPSITLPKGGTLADATNVLREGLHSGTSAITEGIKKAKKDNPNPNLNVQTPKDLYEKGRQMLHDAATNVSQFVNKNTDSIYTNPEKDKDFTDDPKPKPKPDPFTIPDEELAGAGVSEADSVGGGYGKLRKGERSRKQANLTGSRGRSILTNKSYG